MIVVDSSVWIAALSRVESQVTLALRKAVATGEVLVADLVLMEVLRGIANGDTAKKTLAQMSAFPIVEIGGADIAIKAAFYYRLLRAGGFTLRSGIDIMLAAYCIEGAHELLHKDRDFEHFEKFGLLAVNAGSAASR